MKEHTIQANLAELFDTLEDMKQLVSDLENKVKRAKIHHQLLNDDMWCEKD